MLWAVEGKLLASWRARYEKLRDIRRNRARSCAETPRKLHGVSSGPLLHHGWLKLPKITNHCA